MPDAATERPRQDLEDATWILYDACNTYINGILDLYKRVLGHPCR